MYFFTVDKQLFNYYRTFKPFTYAFCIDGWWHHSRTPNPQSYGSILQTLYSVVHVSCSPLSHALSLDSNSFTMQLPVWQSVASLPHLIPLFQNCLSCSQLFFSIHILESACQVQQRAEVVVVIWIALEEINLKMTSSFSKSSLLIPEHTLICLVFRDSQMYFNESSHRFS